MRAIGLSPVVALPVGFWQLRHEADGQAHRQGRDDAVELATARRAVASAGGAPCHDPLSSLVSSATTGECQAHCLLPEMHLPAEPANRCHQRIVELLKAAAEIAQVEAAIVDARPEPGHGNLGEAVAKLLAQQRL